MSRVRPFCFFVVVIVVIIVVVLFGFLFHLYMQSSQEVSVSSTVATGELSGSTGAVATAASAFSNYVDSVTEEDEAVKAFGKNPHPYTAPSRPKDDDEEERVPLDLFWGW